MNDKQVLQIPHIKCTAWELFQAYSLLAMIRPTTAEEVRQVLDDYEKMIADQGGQQVEVVTYDKMSRRERDTVDYIVGELYSISQDDAVQIVVELGINEARKLGNIERKISLP